MQRSYPRLHSYLLIDAKLTSGNTLRKSGIEMTTQNSGF